MRGEHGVAKGVIIVFLGIAGPCIDKCLGSGGTNNHNGSQEVTVTEEDHGVGEKAAPPDNTWCCGGIAPRCQFFDCTKTSTHISPHHRYEYKITPQSITPLKSGVKLNPGLRLVSAVRVSRTSYFVYSKMC